MTMLEKLRIWVAWKLPKGVAYWAAIRVMAGNLDNGPSDEMIETLKRFRLA